MIRSFLRNTLFLDLAIPLLLLVAIAPFTPELDLGLSSYFFDPVQKTFSTHPFFYFMYTWGLLPGQVIGCMALVIWLASYKWKKIDHWRKPALVVGLTIAIGAGLITQLALKEYWKRPRPRQIEQFGGSEPFKPFWQPNFYAVGKFKSFPSGHCTMGFCFFSLVVLGRRYKNKPLFYAGLAAAVLLGLGLSIARIAQGGHFFSDTLFAAYLMWITAVISDWFLFSKTSEANSALS